PAAGAPGRVPPAPGPAGRPRPGPRRRPPPGSGSGRTARPAPGSWLPLRLLGLDEVVGGVGGDGVEALAEAARPDDLHVVDLGAVAEAEGEGAGGGGEVAA